jgi:dolichol-phosphate mannosyltransferase
MAVLEDTVSIVVPTFDEAQSLPLFLGGVKSALEGLLDYEVIIADDRSPDGTGDLAWRLAEDLSVPLRVVTRSGPRSLSLSVLEGIKAARHGCVVVLDADLSHDPMEIPALAQEVLGGRCDVAIASRYTTGGEIGFSWPRWRRLLSFSGTRLARFLTRVADPLSGYFACRRELLAGAVELRPRGYKILLELLARAPELRVIELPSRFGDRRRGVSKLKLRQKLQFLGQVLSLAQARIQSAICLTPHTHPRRAS